MHSKNLILSFATSTTHLRSFVPNNPWYFVFFHGVSQTVPKWLFIHWNHRINSVNYPYPSNHHLVTFWPADLSTLSLHSANKFLPPRFSATTCWVSRTFAVYCCVECPFYTLEPRVQRSLNTLMRCACLSRVGRGWQKSLSGGFIHKFVWSQRTPAAGRRIRIS